MAKKQLSGSERKLNEIYNQFRPTKEKGVRVGKKKKPSTDVPSLLSCLQNTWNNFFFYLTSVLTQTVWKSLLELLDGRSHIIEFTILPIFCLAII